MFKIIRNRALRSYTDSLYLMNFCMVQIYTILCFVFLFLSAYIPMGASSVVNVLKTILVCCWTELGTHTGIVVYKATKENINKHSISEVLSRIEPEVVDDSDDLGVYG